MTKFFFELKKTVFYPFLVHFPNFFLGGRGGQIIFFFFSENPALSYTTSHGFLAPSQNLEKTNITFPRKYIDRRKDGRKDRWKDGRTGCTDPGICRGCNKETILSSENLFLQANLQLETLQVPSSGQL